MVEMEARKINLPKGETLEIEMDPKFLSYVARHFGLPGTSAVKDDHIRMFIWGATKNAIDKSEKQQAIAHVR